MDYLHSIDEIRKIDKIKNEDIRKLCGMKSLERHMDDILLVWYGHAECTASRIVSLLLVRGILQSNSRDFLF